MENQPPPRAEPGAVMFGFGKRKVMTLQFNSIRLMKTQFEENRLQDTEFRADSLPGFDSSPRTILLISVDTRFYENLRSSANKAGIMVVKTDHVEGMIAVLRAVRPRAVLLDLDLPDGAAWETADLLLNEPDCAGVILITGRSGHLEMQSAIAAGSLVSKNDSPDRLLEIIDEGLEMPQLHQTERNTVQRMLIRWLAPSAWADSTPAHRFWGINE